MIISFLTKILDFLNKRELSYDKKKTKPAVNCTVALSGLLCFVITFFPLLEMDRYCAA
jgi:hypothetical protein